MRSKYFGIKELVSKQVYDKYGDKAWMFINPKIINFLDTLRQEIGQPIIVNDWCFGGSLQQRGLRTNKDPIVANKNTLYVSQHILGNAVDFHVKNKSIKDIYNHIINNYDKYKDFITRIENIETAPTWVHVDCANIDTNNIVVFRG